MYTGVALWCGFTPMALGSWLGELLSLGMILVILWRLIDEESHLRAHLNGYSEYCGFVRWRLIPYLF
jgi:protein-S-isoprenylcysteine O-methyltransferase Ste14